MEKFGKSPKGRRRRGCMKNMDHKSESFEVTGFEKESQIQNNRTVKQLIRYNIFNWS